MTHSRMTSLAAGFVILLARVAAAGGPISASGNITCAWTGRAIVRPAAVFGGTAATLSLRFRGTLGSCSGTQADGVDIVAGHMKARGAAPSNDCGALGQGPAIPMTATIRWKVAPGTPRVVPSTIVFGGADFIVGGAIALDFGGASFVTGSFAGDAPAATVVSDELTGAFVAACNASGVRTLTFTGLNGPATVTLQ